MTLNLFLTMDAWTDYFWVTMAPHDRLSPENSFIFCDGNTTMNISLTIDLKAALFIKVIA